jgi:hypothetical protein
MDIPVVRSEKSDGEQPSGLSSSLGRSSTSPTSLFEAREAMFHLSPDDVARFASGYERENHASFLERSYAARDLSSRLRLQRLRPIGLPLMANTYWTRICEQFFVFFEYQRQ